MTIGYTAEAERALRIDLAAAYRLVARYGWDDLVFTHLSARLPGPDHHFLMNPYGLMFDEVTASSLVKVDLQGHALDSNQSVNPAGFTIHSAVHEARADAQCVMHLHTIHGVAVSCQPAGLLPLQQQAMVLNGQIAYHDFEGIALNDDERPRLVADLGDKDLMILRNHGTMAVGRSVGDAFMKMYFLERGCETQIAAQSGGALHLPAASVQGVVAGQARAMADADISSTLVWPALLRRVHRDCPGFDN